jgi:hypothetical protein
MLNASIMNVVMLIVVMLNSIVFSVVEHIEHKLPL